MIKCKQWIFLCLFGWFASGVVLAEKLEIATVDMQKLFKEYHRAISEQKSINDDYAREQKIITEKAELVKSMRFSIESIAAEMQKEGLSEKQKLAKQRKGKLIAQELKIAQRDLNSYRGNVQAKIAKSMAISTERIMGDLRKFVGSYSEKMDYDYVFDRSGLNTNQVGFFLYLKDATDITDEVIEELNQSASESGTE